MSARTLTSLCLCLLINALVPLVSSAAETPNILLIFVDNVGYGDLGCYGNREIRTPNIDRLASEGVRCTDFYCASPSCTPSRGGLLTGRHPERNGLNWQLNAKQNISGYGLPLTEKILPQYLKPLGYATGAFGKWNLGFAPGARPTDRGFDEFLGHASGNIHYYKYLYAGQNDLRSGAEVADGHGAYSTDLFADGAIDFIRRHKDQPWLVYLPFNAVHFVSGQNVEKGEKIEWQVPAKYLAEYGYPEDETDQKKRFRAVVTALDDAIGRVLQTVDDIGQRERTIVFCISDNGAFMLPSRGLEVQSNAPLRDGGVTTYEGGIRVPAIVRWPGKAPAGTTCSAMLSTLDVLPTVVSACGAALPSDPIVDGADMSDILSGKQPALHDVMYWMWKEGKDQYWRGMRERNWKIVRRTDASAWELYDLQKDVGESSDLAAGNPDRVQSMSAMFDRWLNAVRSDPTRGIVK